MKVGTTLILLTLPCIASAFTPAKVTTTITNQQQQQPITQLYQYATQAEGYVNVQDLYTPRDVYSMEEWATQYGVQKANGVELYSSDGGNDYSLLTNAPISAGESVVFVPSSVVLSSSGAQQEFGTSLAQAEQYLVQIDQGAEYRLPLFRLMAKILVEYEKGSDSIYFPWLNSMPRQFFNGVSMTKACFKCLPPYAGWLTSNERLNYSHFALALRRAAITTTTRISDIPLSQETISNKEVVKWAYNVALTRYHETWQPERAKLIGPIADMLNHAANANCEVTTDYEGNMNVVALYDIPAGSPLTISYGDPTNPTPIFAQYGFLPNDCSTIFCKAMHLERVMYELNYDFKDLLIQTETGEIAPPVWDLFLYDVLQKNDQNAANEFYIAVQNGDEGTKEQYHNQYREYTLAGLKEHVYSIMSDCMDLTYKAQMYDINTHPRVPVIVAHNELVSQTFTMTAALLEQMG